jgi:hypothetical protein
MDYNECVSLIDATAARDTEVRTVVADVYELGPEVGIREYDAQEAIRFINAVNRMDGGTAAQPKAAQQAQAKPQQPARVAARRPIFGEVAKELEGALSTRPKPIPQPQIEEDLVLPKLSLQDQINELEKISIGLAEGAFDDEQMAIINKEVGGLGRAEATPTDDFQKNLLRIRNARLKEVSKKLGM